MSFSPLMELFFSWTVLLLLAANLALFGTIVGLHLWTRLGGQQNRQKREEDQKSEPNGSAAAGGGPRTANGRSPLALDKASQSDASGKGEREHKLMAVMGSGGHSSEMLRLLKSLVNDMRLFPLRTYVMAKTDAHSRRKVEEFEKNYLPEDDEECNSAAFPVHSYTLRLIPRAREVGQSYHSAVGTTLVAAWHSLVLIWRDRPDLVLSNGPAIGFPICLFARLLDLFRVHQCRIVFVESICRVKKLSLTGRLLYHLRIPHALLVQWPQLQQKYPRTEFIGRLV